MPDISIRSRRLAYEARPEIYDKSALAVIFIHGSGGDREDWRGQLEGLSDQATIIALELPGHGASEPPGETTIPAYSQWVTNFVETLGLRKVVLVGCSLGSAITQWIALSTPSWLVGIGLVGAGARLRVHPAFLDRMVIRQAELSLFVQMALEAGLGVLGWIDDELAALATSLDMEAAGAVAALAALAFALAFAVGNGHARVGCKLKVAHFLLVARLARFHADVFRTGDHRRGDNDSI